MALDDRSYWREDSEGGYPADGRARLRLGLPKPTRGVIALIVLCLAVFIVESFSLRIRFALEESLALWADRMAQLWRLISFQFLHADAEHIMWNMVGLYFFAPPLEQRWGTRRFLLFYLACGAFAGVSFWAMSLIWPAEFLVLVGASGGIMAALMACAILYPEMMFVIFPIRWVAGFYVVLYMLSIFHDRRYADAAHLGGMVAAALWIWAAPRLGIAFQAVRERADKTNPNSGAWQRRMKHLAEEQARVDEILQKIHDKGIASLTGREKRILQEATRRQREQERQIDKR